MHYTYSYTHVKIWLPLSAICYIWRIQASGKITQSCSSFIVMHILSYLLYQHYSFRETLRCSEPGDVSPILLMSSVWSQCPLARLSGARMGADPMRSLSRPAKCDVRVGSLKQSTTWV